MADIAVVLGTRPEIIKLAPVIHELDARALLIHTGQHYDEELSGSLLRELNVPPPASVLSDIGGGSRAQQIGRAVLGLSEEFDRLRPSAVIVQGDTNTVNAGAQAAHYLGIPVVHVEAGLRSYDRSMPEEINRGLVGILADVHCAPTAINRSNLEREGVAASRIALTGNTVVESTWSTMERAGRPVSAWFDGQTPDSYAVATIHRPENTDTRHALERVLRDLNRLPVPVILLAHPRTRAAISRHGLSDLAAGLRMVEAAGPADFLTLARNAAVVISDSGGVQEEVTVLKVPLVVVRRSTERPEAVAVGFATLVGPQDDLTATVVAILSDPIGRQLLQSIPSPYGDGLASRRIARISEFLADGEEPDVAIRRGLHVVAAGVGG